MSDLNTAPARIKPDAPAHESMARCASIVMASIAAGGLLVWLALGAGETYSDSVAPMAGDSDMRRSMFTEKNRQLYVAVPPNAVQPRPVAPPQAELASSAASMASLTVLPKTSPPVKDEAVQPALDETTQSATAEQPSTTTDLDAAYEPKPAEPTQHASTLDEQISARPVPQRSTDEPATEEVSDEPSLDEPASAEPEHDEPSWDDEPSAESIMDEPTDAPDESDEPS